MKKIALISIRLLVGYFVCAIGMVMTLNANLGALPWDVLHQGIGNITGLTIGRANIILGFIIILIDVILGENIGWGTVFNMFFIGIFVDLIMINKLIPIFNTFLPSLIMMFVGMLVLGYGCYIYMSVGLGSGPRDGLMVALNKKTKKSIRLVKASMDVFALTVGYFLGGFVGIGTAIMSVMGGYFIQLAFKTVNFNASEVEHRFIIEDIRFIRERLLVNENDEA